MQLYLGARIDVRDSQGNTALHYAAKYCHLELCKFLVTQRVPVPARNSNNQTAYDVTENHVIRQYLLPLQFQNEQPSMDSGYSGNSMSQYNIPHQQPVGGYPPAPSPLRQSAGAERRVPSAQSSPSAQPVPPTSFPGAVPPGDSHLFGARPPEPLQLAVNNNNSVNSNISNINNRPGTPPSFSVPMPPPMGAPHVAAAGLGFQQSAPLAPTGHPQTEEVYSSPAPVPAPAPVVQSYTPTAYMQSAANSNTRIIQPGMSLYLTIIFMIFSELKVNILFIYFHSLSRWLSFLGFRSCPAAKVRPYQRPD